MSKEKKIWKGLEELVDSEVAQKMRNNEFAEKLPVDEFLGNDERLENSSTSRRDFLKYVGFSTAAATLASCETPITKSIPYVNAPEEIIPGIANYYATTYFDGHDYASILVKTREGRPIKVEHNKLAKVNGSANARVHASVLNLYDETRLMEPTVAGKATYWDDLDKEVTAGFQKASDSGKQVVLLSASMISPSARKLVNDFGTKYAGFRHVSYDSFSYSGKLDAIEAATGKRALPMYNFRKADVVVGFNSDFLSDLMGQSVSSDYASRRIPGENMSRHFHFESQLTNTGSAADKRYKLRSSNMGAALVALYNELSGSKLPGGNTDLSKEIKAVAAELKKAGKNGLVVSGSNDKDIESITIAINELLGNSGTTIDYSTRSNLRQGDDKALDQLIADMNAGKVGAIIIHNLNPGYVLAGNDKFMSGLSKVDTSVYIAQKYDETASLVKYVCAESNYLESWGDAEPFEGIYSIQQPTIRPLFQTRQFEECLMAWTGKSGSYHDYLKGNWSGMSNNWAQTVHDGVYPVAGKMAEAVPMNGHEGLTAENNDSTAGNDDGLIASLMGGTASSEAAANSSSVDLSAAARNVGKGGSEGYELNFYQMTGMGTGNLANNPWLLEFPDPISRISWDNYVCISAADAIELGVENWSSSNGALNGHCLDITVNGKTLEGVPVLVQPGQAPKTLSLAVGWGREAAGKAADGVGKNAFMLMDKAHSTSVDVAANMKEHGYASVQLAHTMMGRKIVNETSLDTFLNEPASNDKGTGWNQAIHLETYKGPLAANETNLWDDFDHDTGHMWNMSIDLNLCNGCGACVIACHSENNVPVVGKDEIRRHRDMHWLRIDRYYSTDMNEEAALEEGLSAMEMYARMESAGEDPDVHFQPVMCQHCNHAPCETVCPVIATSHSSEGLNHMAYNRCIGTRYCANNCPYKVRRFNWFQYHDGSREQFDVNYAMNSDLGRMVLNPDVTVRSRGVMEKCSMCIQRIQLGKLEAKKEGKKLKDGSVQTACMSACDTGAIVFGDVNDHDSRVYKLKQNKRMYHLLEEVGTQPSVFYQTKVRNRA